MKDLADRVLAGERRAVARALSVMEAGGPRARALSDDLWAHTGRALRIGVTGAPGVGKSTLVDRLATALAKTRRVGIIAVDPSSAFSRGALLGDRIRMAASAGDDAVFIRSMATRGRLGGLAPASSDAADVLDAAGFDVVFVETVGVGQSEVDVAFETDYTVVVLAPGAGDGVQALKAGLMEAADVFCVHKCDMPGAEGVRCDVAEALSLLAEDEIRRDAPIVLVSSKSGEGLDVLKDTIEARGAPEHAEALSARRRNVVRRRLETTLTEAAYERARARVDDALVERVTERSLAMGAAARELLEEKA